MMCGEESALLDAPMGTTLRVLLELAGGMKDGIPLKVAGDVPGRRLR